VTSFQIGALVLVGVVGAMRLGEVLVSARRAGRAARERWWPLMVALHAAVLAGCAAHVVLVGDPPPVWLGAAAGAALIAATALRVWVLATLRGRWNVRVVEPGSIVTTGPYAHVRHPNYLAVILEVAALPLAVGAIGVAIAASVANALVLSLRIPFEEEQLLARHPEYRRVMLARPRLLPARSRTRRQEPQRHKGHEGCWSRCEPSGSSRPGMDRS
jgi:methyltransferase